MNPEDRCFCELAPLYALGLLKHHDRQWVEQQVIDCPDLADELTDFQVAVAAIPYAAPAVPMAVDLKDRLFQRIEQTSTVENSGNASLLGSTQSPETLEVDQPSADQGERSILRSLQERLQSFFRSNDRIPLNLSSLIRRSQTLKWRPYKVSGVMVAPLHINLLKGEVTALVRAEPGVRYPVHRHAEFEEIYMLEGDLIIGEEVLYAGDYIRSEHASVHAPETQGGCMFFVRTSLMDEYPKDVAGLSN